MRNIRAQIIRKGETKTPKRTSQLASERLKHGGPFRNPLHISNKQNIKVEDFTNEVTIPTGQVPSPSTNR